MQDEGALRKGGCWCSWVGESFPKKWRFGQEKDKAKAWGYEDLEELRASNCGQSLGKKTEVGEADSG
jgi:hypothetical protein